MEVMLPAHIAARLAGFYSMRTAGYALRSAWMLGALGYRVEGLAPAHGLSLHGTADEPLCSGDVGRKLWVKMETQADLSQPVRLPPPHVSVRVKVRGRASRRVVKQAGDTAEAETRARKVAAQWVDWYNQHVGLSMAQYARLGKGKRIRILDTTHIAVSLETRTYESIGVGKNDDGAYVRGYQLATVRTLLGNAGVLRQGALAAIYRP